MTAVEKAKELVKKYRNIDFEVGGQYDGYANMKIHDAKECALILIEEALEIISAMDDSHWYSPSVDFWKEVKQEIERL